MHIFDHEVGWATYICNVDFGKEEISSCKFNCFNSISSDVIEREKEIFAASRKKRRKEERKKCFKKTEKELMKLNGMEII